MATIANDPKVQKILKTVPVSEKMASKLIARFLDREGQEEIVLDESLTRLQTICQSMGGEIIQHHTQVEAPIPTTPMIIPEEEEEEQEEGEEVATTIPVVASSVGKKKKASSADKAAIKSAKKEAKKEAKSAKKSAKKEAKKSAKKEKKEAKKMKEKRKHEGTDEGGASQLCTVVQSWTTSSTVIQRIQAQDFNVDEYYKDNNPRPLLIANVLSPQQCKQSSDAIMALEHQMAVEMIQQIHNQGTEAFPGVPLVEAMDAILYHSTSTNSYLTFCEGLMEVGGKKGPLQGIRQLILNARENIFPDDPDWFANYFPAGFTPSDAVIMAGSGAASKLHRDPFDWMGTSLCVDGSTVWRFVDPHSDVNAIDVSLKSYRSGSIDWKGQSMSAGWESDFSLYKNRQHDALPGVRQWYEFKNEEQKQLELQRVGSSMELLAPDNLEDTSDLAIATVIQQAGDLLLIPANWWQQTYTLEPSVSIVSQRCGRHDITSVMQHILNHNDITSTDATNILAGANQSPAKAMDGLFAAVK